jgi:ferritin-like protein
LASDTLHEPAEKLAAETIDRHRAISSVMEELEAVDWYDQRVDATDDAELKAILAHNRDEEKEHACMVLEWLRRHDPKLDEHMREYLFTTGSITGREAQAEGKEDAAGGSLGIGSLKAEVGA